MTFDPMITKDTLQSTSKEPPLVTVLIGCYNQARFVVETLESLRQQNYPNLQLIIWDDCSRDNSVEVIQSWIREHNFECTFLAHSVNYGICKSVNAALALARGKYVCFVAADDLFMPDRITRQVGILEKAPADVGLVYSDAFLIDENGGALPRMFIEMFRKFDAPPEGSLFDALFEGNFIPAMTTLVRRECFTQVGTYDEDLCFEDWDMWMRISRAFKFVYDKIPAAKYRIVSTSHNRAMSKEVFWSGEILKVKYLFRGWLNAKQGKIAASALPGVVSWLYQTGRRIPFRWKVGLLKQNFSPNTICLVLFSTCGVSFGKFQLIAVRPIIPDPALEFQKFRANYDARRNFRRGLGPPPENVPGLPAMGRSWYAICWLTHKITQPFKNLARSVRKRGRMAAKSSS